MVLSNVFADKNRPKRGPKNEANNFWIGRGVFASGNIPPFINTEESPGYLRFVFQFFEPIIPVQLYPPTS